MAIGKRVKGITIEFDGDTTKLNRALSDVDKKTKDVDRSLEEVARALKFNPNNTELLAQKQQKLKEKVQQTKEKLDLLRQAQKKLDDDPSVDRMSKDYTELRREIIETESKLKHFEKEARKLNNVKMTKLGNQFKTVGSKMQSVGKSATMYVSAPIAAAGTVAVKKFAEVDKTMQLTNATMKNTEQESKLLSDAMKNAASESTYGMDEAAQATLNFARAGLDAKEASEALAPAMNLAAGEGGELDTVSAGLVATINGFGDSFENASAYADVFANACNNSALDVNSLSDAMSVAAPIFSAAGYSVNDAALYMGVMANSGIEASVAANSLKTGMARLVEPSKQGAEWMEKLGISMTNADGTMKDTVTVQSELHDSFATLSESEQIAAASAIFGKNQMSNWLALINSSPDDVAKLNTQIEKTGTTTEMAEKMMSGFGGSLEKIKSGLDVAATSLGEALAPMIAKVAEWIQAAVDWFNKLSPTAQRIIAVILAIVAAIGPLLVVGGLILSLIGTCMTVIPMLLPVIASIAAPVLIVIAAVAALVAIGIALYKNWDKIKEKASQLKNWVVDKFNAMKDGVKKTFNSIKEAMVKPIEKAKNMIKAIVDKIKGFLKFKFKLPKIKLPHFSITPPGWNVGDLLHGEIPHLGINWYAKGGIFANPSVIGVGEAGDEAVVPLNALWKKFDEMTNDISNAIATGLALQSSGANIPGSINVVVELGGSKVGEQIVNLYDYTKRAKG